jgi:hypothetical protein
MGSVRDTDGARTPLPSRNDGEGTSGLGITMTKVRIPKAFSEHPSSGAEARFFKCDSAHRRHRSTFAFAARVSPFVKMELW